MLCCDAAGPIVGLHLVVNNQYWVALKEKLHSDGSYFYALCPLRSQKCPCFVLDNQYYISLLFAITFHIFY